MNIKRSQFLALALAAAASPALAACGGKSATSLKPVQINPEGEIKPREISWLLSRAANGAVINTMQEIAEEYAKDHKGFKLTLITTPDRPSYIQKYETLAAANKRIPSSSTPMRPPLLRSSRSRIAWSMWPHCSTT